MEALVPNPTTWETAERQFESLRPAGDTENLSQNKNETAGRKSGSASLASWDSMKKLAHAYNSSAEDVERGEFWGTAARQPNLLHRFQATDKSSQKNK